MVVLLLLLFFITVYKIQAKSFNETYLSVNETNSIKGFFAVIIMFSHMIPYMTLSSAYYDAYFSKAIGSIGQMMVAMYFFYSGYGILESIKRKKDYAKSFFHNRIWKTFIHFCIAVILYIILSFLIGKEYEPYKYITCWIGWNSIGNSNWFIFVILSLYIITYIVMHVVKQNELNSICTLIFILSIISVPLKLGRV